ncbi:hypothetical protein FFH90_005505 [Pseudomonas sp. ATCC 43928]|nr:hypothetical protein FFH90_005505 [Pseudomonas sp. ATCC 43928]
MRKGAIGFIGTYIEVTAGWLWRGSLLPPGREAAPKSLQSMKILWVLRTGAPARSSGSKLPRHRGLSRLLTTAAHPPSCASSCHCPAATGSVQSPPPRTARCL